MKDLDKRNKINNLTKIENLNLQIKDIQLGFCHSFLLDKSGFIYGTGCNEYGELGTGDYIYRYEFTKIKLNFKVIKIACSRESTLILNEFNELYGTGDNGSSQIGLKERYNVFTKININFFDKLEKINYLFTQELPNSIFITNYNNIYFCGDNYFNRFGLLYNDCKEIKQFTKLNNFKTTDKYIIPVLSYQLLIFTSHYKINGEEDNNNNEEIITNYQLNKVHQLFDISVHLF